MQLNEIFFIKETLMHLQQEQEQLQKDLELLRTEFQYLQAQLYNSRD